MSRSLAILIIAIASSATLAQENAKDPVERMTDRIMRQFMPSWLQSAPVQVEQSIDRPEPGQGFRTAKSRAPSFFSDMDLDDGFDQIPDFDAMPRDFPAFPPMRAEAFGPRGFARATSSASSSSSSSSSATAGVMSAPSAWRTATVKTTPRPLSISRASSNGVHAIDAVIPTLDGPRRLELKGTTTQVIRQVDDLPAEAREIMREALGL